MANLTKQASRLIPASASKLLLSSAGNYLGNRLANPPITSPFVLSNESIPPTAPPNIDEMMQKYKSYLQDINIDPQGENAVKPKKQTKKKPTTKTASSSSPYPGMSQHAVYDYAPVSGTRELDDQEKKDVEKGKSRWLPKIFQSYKTRPHEMMASPGKQSLLALLGGGLLGAGAMGGLTSRATGNPSDSVIGAAGGAALGGPLAALLTYFGRRASNEDIEDLMSRVPKGSTKRDILTDPVYQADLNRTAMMGGGGGYYNIRGFNKYSNDMMGTPNMSMDSGSSMGYGTPSTANGMNSIGGAASTMPMAPVGNVGTSTPISTPSMGGGDAMKMASIFGTMVGCIASRLANMKK